LFFVLTINLCNCS